LAPQAQTDIIGGKGDVVELAIVALLEAMQERQVTVEGETKPLPRPFLVIAGQPNDELVATLEDLKRPGLQRSPHQNWRRA
jgi:hypothetical protein